MNIPSEEVRTPTIFAPPARTFIPVLAVTIPIASILVTSSYVNVPPIVTFPVKVAAPETFILSNGPSNLVAVIMPYECML